jgi:hypothetical protein
MATITEPPRSLTQELTDATIVPAADSITGVSNADTVDAQPFDDITAPGQHAAEAEHEYPTGAKFYTICLSLALLLVLGGIDGSIVATAVPRITDHFHTVADVGWYSVAYRLPIW